uniref:Gastrula zinc finger protein xFG20-1 n=2 Tax=Culex pipiens TaxID=7175 RepID=A0A8D8I8F2_CULPI
MEFQPCDNSKVLLIRAETYLTISGRAIQVSKVLRHDCYPCSSFSQMATEQLATVVKEEPPEEEPEVSSFSYETVTKEEVILDEDGELVENADQPESVREHPTEISQERPFKCPECDRTFAKAAKLNACVRKHHAIKLGLYRCKHCGKLTGTKYDLARHEGTHKKGTKLVQLNEDVSGSEQGTSKKDPSQKDDCSIIGEDKTGNSPRINPRDENGLFKCSECDRTYKKRISTINCAKRHLAKRLGIHRCKICNLRAVTPSALKRHERTHLHKPHPEQSHHEDATESEQPAKKAKKGDENSTSFCYETVLKEELIIEDELAAEDESEKDSHNSVENNQPTTDESRRSKFKCTICARVYAQKRYLTHHKKSHQKSLQPLECRQCHETFEDRHSFYLHSKIHKNVSIRMQYEELLERDKDSESNTCLLCEKSFRLLKTALCHVQRHMTILDGIFQCKVCGSRFASEREYQAHIKTHKKKSNPVVPPKGKEGVHIDYNSSSKDPCENSDLPLHCKTCDVFFDSTKNFQIHMLKSKLRIIQQKLAADGKQLTQKRKSALPRDTSKLTMGANGFYNCSKCDYKTINPRNFRGHVHNHRLVELGLFTCEFCQQRFTTKSRFENHRKSHTKTDVECSTCHEKFATRKDFFRHRIVHVEHGIPKQFREKVTVDEKGVFTCSICGKTHTNKKNAFGHFSAHVVEKFKCAICQKVSLKIKHAIICFRVSKFLQNEKKKLFAALHGHGNSPAPHANP